jgi:hypothetical protein
MDTPPRLAWSIPQHANRLCSITQPLINIVSKACQRNRKVLDLLLNLIHGPGAEIRLHTNSEPRQILNGPAAGSEPLPMIRGVSLLLQLLNSRISPDQEAPSKPNARRFFKRLPLLRQRCRRVLSKTLPGVPGWAYRRFQEFYFANP